MPDSSKATLSYSFGDMEIRINVSGNTDRSVHLENNLLTAMVATTSLQVEEHSLSDRPFDDSATHQTCSSTVKFGDLDITVELEFNLRQHVSKRTLNTIVFSVILPKVWQTAGAYLGDSRILFKQSHRDAMYGLDSALTSSGQYGAAADSSQQSSEQLARPGQLVSSH